MDSTRKTKTELIEDILKELEKKTRALIPFSANLLVGDRQKLGLLMLFNRHRQTAETKSYYHALNLANDLTRKLADTDLIMTPPNNTSPIKVDFATLFSRLQAQPFRVYKSHRKNRKNLSTLELMENSVKNSVKNRVGNCYELASLLIMMLRELKPYPNLTIKYEAIMFAGRADHELVVINRDPSSDISDLRTWGPDAIICDPWFRETVNVSHQLSLHPQHQANIITFLLVYRDEPYQINISDIVNNKPPHSTHWYEKYGHDDQQLFINRKPEIRKDAALAEHYDKQVTTLFIATKLMHIDVIAALLNYGVDANPEGLLTPLAYAVVASNADITDRTKAVELLLKAGATPHQETPDGHSLLSFAKQHQLTDIANLLENAQYQHPTPSKKI